MQYPYRPIVFILLVLVFVHEPALAQRYTFQRLNGPAGGPVHAVLPLPDGRIIAGTSYHIFSSANGGSSWTRLAGPLPGYQVGSLARDSAGTLFAAIGPGLNVRSNVYRSTDGGTTWLPSGSGIPGTAEISALAADRDGNMYAATYQFGIYRSADHGTSWHAVSVRDEHDSTIRDLYAIRFAGGHGGPLYAMANYGIYRSVDSGALWRVCTPTAGMAGMNLMIDSAGALYIGGEGVIARSNDSGATFGTLAAEPRLPSAFIRTASGTFLGLRGDTLFRSIDTGTSWQAVNVCPYFARVNDYIMRGGEILLATNQGLFRSTDDGGTWQAASKNLLVSTVTDLAADSTGVVVAAAPGQGIYSSMDRGATWNNLGPAGAGAYPGYYYAGSVACDRMGHLYALSLDSIHVSMNGGGSWFVPRNTDEPLAGSTILTTPGGLALAAFTNGAGGSLALARSTDYGASWATYSIYPTGSAFRFQMLANGHLFAGTSNQIMYSLDTGRTWRQRGSSIPDNRPARELLATRSGNLLAATPNGLYRTADEGVAWTLLVTPFAADSVHRLVQLRSGRILALVPPRLFASDDDGTTWDTAYAGELRLTQITESADGDLYAGILGEGLARSTGTVGVPAAEAGPDRAVVVRGASMHRDGTIALRYVVAAPGAMSVDISDLAGRTHALLSIANRAGGEQSVELATVPLAAGVYLCRLSVNGGCATLPILVTR